ncbi:cation-translocating P-type ATPase [Mangrovicella endophytica]|uniref:cation-translocating P-type ATPase n=1 Tax=Mangrovicella endophytica TaxID=2066697 RepID=UPI000C9E2717|nr:cation-transporting P-type ATPase [Mangrovicella endophytica]
MLDRPSADRPEDERQSVVPWHALDEAELFSRLGGESGLTEAEAERRRLVHGVNRLPEAARRTLPLIVLSQLKGPLILLLLAAGLLSLAFGDVEDAVFILLVLILNSCIGAAQEWRAEANTAALRSAVPLTARVRRDGVVRSVDASTLVPGDVVILEAGDRIPADLRIHVASDLQVDEAALTGESLPVEKAPLPSLPPDTPLADRLNMLHAASTVQRGRAEALVVAIGAATELGRIALAVAERAPLPPLTLRLERLSRFLGVASVVLVGLVLGLQLAMGAPLRQTVFVAVALAVSVIPEGLPVAVTVALSVATRRMARRNVIVRQLAAVEGLGACTVVATDKTGTLTVNVLTAKRVWLPDHGNLHVEGEGHRLEGGVRRDGVPLHGEAQLDLHRLGRTAALCNDAFLPDPESTQRPSGDAVDLAFLVLAVKASLDLRTLAEDAPRLAEIPFDATRKLAASLNRHEDGHRLHVKGAAEVIVPLCRDVDIGGVLDAADRMAAEGFRVLAVASRMVETAGTSTATGADLEAHLADLTLLGLVGFIDPLRPEARQAVAACRRAGVSIKMITGDHAATALAIARDLGIAETSAEVISGAELRALQADDAVSERILRAAVFARVEPEQKVRIVGALREAGEVVAMTGDGVNDAPALRQADLGVAMGRGGTDAARDAADLVLADDNFASIVAGIEEGRAAYANIRKVVYLLVSTGAAEVVLFLLSIASGLPAPLSAVQLLWLNLVTNGGQDVALAFEKREAELLSRPPRRPGEPIFDRLMIRQTGISGLYMGAAAFATFAWLLSRGWSEFEARNALLFLFVLFENIHVFNCRSELRSAFSVPPANNWPLMAAVGGAQTIHIGAAFVPGLRDVLEIAPISLGLWLVLVPIAASALLVMELDKLLLRRRR